ncbi:FUSC family protein [Shinella sp. S4-D37]|uniref:FUSC family protein n=1 Tax=Shinella sp. S4-D37 TaxID=3161999 RepID=UPI003466E62D
MSKPSARRWPFALRAALAMGVPAAAGWLAGDLPAGLMATIGGFTAVYGNDRPFVNRAFHLGAIAIAFALAVMIGVAAGGAVWLTIPVIALIATAAAFLCSALKVSPPGAYLFTLAVAAGTAMGAEHLAWWHVGALVFAGGAFAWMLHMAGAVFAPRGPEVQALKAAARAVGAFLSAAGTPRADIARHQAAIALHLAWTALVGQQPVQPRPDGTLTRLRMEGRELHMIFAEAINASVAGEPIPQASVERVEAIARQGSMPRDVTDPGHIPLGRVSGWQLLRESARPGAQPFEIGLRVAVAAAVSGLIGWVTNIEHAYWITAAAVLMLYQGLDRATMLERGIQRVGGTLIGTVLAGGVLFLHPQGLWLAATVMVLQFIIEMLVLRNYGLAVVFITAIALTIAAGGQPVPDIPHQVWIRAEDTILGCAIGIAVFLLLARRDATRAIAQALLRSWGAIDLVAQRLSSGDADTAEARSARRNLQHHTILLLQSFDTAVGSSTDSRVAAEPLWPAVVATQRLAYRLLAAAWRIEAAAATDGNAALAEDLFGKDGAAQLHAALAEIIAAFHKGAAPPRLPGLPAFLDAEVRLLGNSIVAAAHRA